jgi:aspartate carbamoyltransferase catalytic subunit
MRHLISIKDFNREEVFALVTKALKIKKSLSDSLEKRRGHILAALFFEPSTRTRLSFETAAQRLGMSVIGFADPGASSYGKKGESLEDTIKIVSGYANILAMRHPEEGAAARAAAVSRVPVINAGDGAGEHPTQALLDLVTIYETQGRLDNLTIGFCGDLRFGRTVHSLTQALNLFPNNRFYFTSPKTLRLPEEYRKLFPQAQEKETLREIIPESDILYMTRVQKERFTEKDLLTVSMDDWCLNVSLLDSAKPNLKILHPLPRNKEIPQSIDASPHAAYFLEAENGVYLRMALMDYLLS